MGKGVSNLEQMLDRVSGVDGERGRVSLKAVVDALGRRTFGPILLLAGMVLVSPLSAVPGMATTMGIFILLVAAQLLLQARRFWLPRWLLKRSLSKARLRRVLRWFRAPARVVDHLVRPRLELLTAEWSQYLVALFCLAIAFFLPFMEAVPFSASIAGVALGAFGLSLMAHDGLLALLAFLTTSLAIGLILSRLAG